MITNFITKKANGLISYNYPTAGLEDVFSSQYVPDTESFQGIGGGLIYARNNGSYISIGFLDKSGIVKCEYDTILNSICVSQIKSSLQSTCIIKLSRDGNTIYLHHTIPGSAYDTSVTKYTFDRTNWTITYTDSYKMTYQAGYLLFNTQVILANDGSAYFSKNYFCIKKISPDLSTISVVGGNSDLSGGALCANSNQKIYCFGTENGQTYGKFKRIIEDVVVAKELPDCNNTFEKILKAVITPDNHIVGFYYDSTTGLSKLYWIEESQFDTLDSIDDFNVIDLSLASIDGITGRLYFNQLSCDGYNNLYLTQKNGAEKGVFKIENPFTTPVYTKIANTGERIRTYLDNCHHDPFGYDLSDNGFTGAI